MSSHSWKCISPEGASVRDAAWIEATFRMEAFSSPSRIERRAKNVTAAMAARPTAMAAGRPQRELEAERSAHSVRPFWKR